MKQSCRSISRKHMWKEPRERKKQHGSAKIEPAWLQKDSHFTLYSRFYYIESRTENFNFITLFFFRFFVAAVFLFSNSLQTKIVSMYNLSNEICAFFFVSSIFVTFLMHPSWHCSIRTDDGDSSEYNPLRAAHNPLVASTMMQMHQFNPLFFINIIIIVISFSLFFYFALLIFLFLFFSYHTNLFKIFPRNFFFLLFFLWIRWSKNYFANARYCYYLLFSVDWSQKIDA